MTTETKPPPTSFAHRIAAFYGNHHDFLLWLIANPSRPQTEGMRKLGLAEETLYSWRRDIAGFKEVIDAIQHHRGDLRAEYAQAAMNDAIQPIVDKMVAVAVTDGRDAQRARERILEEVGVLHKEPQIVVNDNSRILMARLDALMALQMGVTVEAKPVDEGERVRRMLGPGDEKRTAPATENGREA